MTILPSRMTRRAVIATAGAAAVATASLKAVSAQTTPRTFVLVHGAWHGGWCWRRVSDRLERKGHKVFAPSLTGLADRSHLISQQVNVTTHITDIANPIRYENLRDVVLVGHSYAGFVISGVAEKERRRSVPSSFWITYGEAIVLTGAREKITKKTCIRATGWNASGFHRDADRSGLRYG